MPVHNERDPIPIPRMIYAYLHQLAVYTPGLQGAAERFASLGSRVAFHLSLGTAWAEVEGHFDGLISEDTTY